MVAWTNQGQQCDQWLADHNNCDIFMSLPMNGEFLMDKSKEKGITQQLKFIKDCSD